MILENGATTMYGVIVNRKEHPGEAFPAGGALQPVRADYRQPLPADSEMSYMRAPARWAGGARTVNEGPAGERNGRGAR